MYQRIKDTRFLSLSAVRREANEEAVAVIQDTDVLNFRLRRGDCRFEKHGNKNMTY